MNNRVDSSVDVQACIEMMFSPRYHKKLVHYRLKSKQEESIQRKSQDQKINEDKTFTQWERLVTVFDYCQSNHAQYLLEMWAD